MDPLKEERRDDVLSYGGGNIVIEGVLAKDENWGTEDESRSVPVPITEDDCVVS